MDIYDLEQQQRDMDKDSGEHERMLAKMSTKELVERYGKGILGTAASRKQP